MSFPSMVVPRYFPVEGCRGGGDDKVVYQSSFHALAHKLHQVNHVGGKPPLSTVPPLLYSGSTGDPECLPHHHRPVRQGGRVEMVSAGSIVDSVKHGKGLPGL